MTRRSRSHPSSGGPTVSRSRWLLIGALGAGMPASALLKIGDDSG
jgi:hypothetical protein